MSVQWFIWQCLVGKHDTTCSFMLHVGQLSHWGHMNSSNVSLLITVKPIIIDVMTEAHALGLITIFFSFVASAEDLSDGEEVFPKEITKWNSNDLMDKIEATDAEETPGMMSTLRTSSQSLRCHAWCWARVCVCACASRWAVQGNDCGLWECNQRGKTRWGMCLRHTVRVCKAESQPCFFEAAESCLIKIFLQVHLQLVPCRPRSFSLTSF